MIEHAEHLERDFQTLAPLDAEQAGDASFRAKDLAWAELIDLFEERKSKFGLNYKRLGDRIGRSRKQVQRWLSTSINMNLTSFGLLAEGLDADIEIKLIPRDDSKTHAMTNYAHPSERAKESIVWFSDPANEIKTESSRNFISDQFFNIHNVSFHRLPTDA